MKLSKYFVPTLKEVPSDATVKSHILMLRSGMIRMVGAGIYSFLPIGYRVVRKISEIIREEMNTSAGRSFICLHLIQKKSGKKQTGLKHSVIFFFILKTVNMF